MRRKSVVDGRDDLRSVREIANGRRRRRDLGATFPAHVPISEKVASESPLLIVGVRQLRGIDHAPAGLRFKLWASG